MSQSSSPARPFSVLLVAVLIILAALGNIIMGVVLIFASLGSNPTYTNSLGQVATVSGFYLWFNGLMMILLGLIYFWLTRLTLAGSNTAHFLITALAVINIIFGFFQLGYGGWAEIIVNLIVVLLVNTQKAKLWFSQTA